MNIVLLSGGSGKRLWPLSNENRSKQFLKLIKNNKDNIYESMVQRVYRQIIEADNEANVIITTGKTQISQIRNQLGKMVETCIEPSRRDTFPAIALSSAFLMLKKGYSSEDIVIICPVDPYTEIDYFKTLKKLEDVIRKEKANIAIMGVKPTYPSEKYGYIIPGDACDEYRKVKKFIEKPSISTANQAIEDGGLWNCGVFAFKIGYMIEKISKYIEYANYEDIYNNYSSFPKISFDYEVLEKENNIVVTEFEGMWKDLGTWNTLTEEMSEPTLGNVIIGSNCSNVNVINELAMPILVMGAKNMIISASSDGIIVSEKNESSYIKPFVESIHRRVMYEEKSWGIFNIINMEQDEIGRESLTIQITMIPNKSFSYHSHENRDEIWTVISGKGEVVVDGERSYIETGDIIKVFAKQKHQLRAITKLSLVEVQIGFDIQDQDILIHTI